MSVLASLGTLLVPAVLLAPSADAPGPRNLTFEDRVRAQWVIEEVYWTHRTWPETNPNAKPLLRDVMTDDAVRSRVADYLQKSSALAEVWEQPLTADQLQKEMERMAGATNAPAVLRELFGALGNDPALIAETLVRQKLVERRIRDAYAYDARIHGAVRRDAERAVAAATSFADLRSRGEYRETIWRLRAEPDAEGGNGAGSIVSLDPVEWERLKADLQHKTGIEETADGFAVTSILSTEPDEFTSATVTWPKTSFQSWWETERNSHAIVLPALAGYRAVEPRETSPCDPAVWRPTFTAEVPSGRQDHTALWTGTEMIVWGFSETTGGRYDPSTDTWLTLKADPSLPHDYFGGHSVVWTGTEMIVWGGFDDFFSAVITGARYNPTSDSWVPTSIAAAPSNRGQHVAVWTGTEMVVWGGRSAVFNATSLNTGGRYNPSTNTWRSTSTAPGTPTPRFAHVAAWTGTEMIVWGGVGDVTLNDGGRYNPATNTWAPVSTGAGVPSARRDFTTVWTGTEMIVWGGRDDASVLNTGARYRPSTDTWTATSTEADVPSMRQGHTAVWTGTEMIVWGGRDFGQVHFNTGGRYNPSTDSWIATPLGAGVPTPRARHSAVWTGTEMVVWSGSVSGNVSPTGGRYNPSTGSWSPTATDTIVPVGRRLHTAVWTGTEMIIWGGVVAGPGNTGGRYDPATDTWVPTSTGAGVPPAQSGHGAVWTGQEMILWGAGGGRYDPLHDTWASMPASGAPTSRSSHAMVWTGTEVIIWGGASSTYTNSGSRYNPTTNTWTVMPVGLTTPSARAVSPAFWTGTRMIIWGGYNGASWLASGGLYDPATDTWTATSTGPGVPTARFGLTSWTGEELIVWGGYNGSRLQTGARYAPASDSWTPMTTIDAPQSRAAPTVWTGTEMIVWGGYNGFAGVNTGGRYNPASDTWRATTLVGAPLEMEEHTMVWTGTSMIAWGGFPFRREGGIYTPVPDVDADADGVGDTCDACSFSDQTPTVIVDNCDSGVSNDVLSTGCTIADLLEPCRGAEQSSVCVAAALGEARVDGRLTRAETMAILRCASGGLQPVPPRTGGRVSLTSATLIP